MIPGLGIIRIEYWKFPVSEPDDSIGLRLHVKPFQKPHPPTGVAGVSLNSATLKLAGEGGGALSMNLVPVNVLRTHWDAVETGTGLAGRCPDRSNWRILREILLQRFLN